MLGFQTILISYPAMLTSVLHVIRSAGDIEELLRFVVSSVNNSRNYWHTILSTKLLSTIRENQGVMATQNLEVLKLFCK